MLKKFLKVLLIAGFLWFSLHIIFTAIDGLNDYIGRSDVGIVLGNKVELDGRPSKRLQSRLDKALDLYNQNYFEHIIVRGVPVKKDLMKPK